MIHLDTSFLIRALARGSAEDHRLRAWLAEGTPLGISAVTGAVLATGNPADFRRFEPAGLKIIAP